MRQSIYRILAAGAVLSTATLVFAGSLDKQGQAWLDQYKNPAQINVSGNWDTGRSGFGALHLQQAQNSRTVEGSGDGYKLDGVVSGKTLYLLFSRKDTVAFCAEVTQNGETILDGTYQYRLSRLRFGAGKGVCQTKRYTLNLSKR